MLKWPRGRELGNPPGVIGMEITADDERPSYIDDGNIAYEERVVEAPTALAGRACSRLRAGRPSAVPRQGDRHHIRAC